jgi:predicted transcriptional regulator
MTQEIFIAPTRGKTKKKYKNQKQRDEAKITGQQASNAKKAEIMQEAIKLATKGCSPKRIADYLNISTAQLTNITEKAKDKRVQDKWKQAVNDLYVRAMESIHQGVQNDHVFALKVLQSKYADEFVPEQSAVQIQFIDNNPTIKNDDNPDPQ